MCPQRTISANVHITLSSGWKAPTFWEPQRNVNPLKSGERVPDVWFNTLHMMFVEGMFGFMTHEGVLALLQWSDEVKNTEVYKV